ncbi:AAA family ATPase [Paraliomyxa miuraensis]|uniref:AAA family ATPase n=1 Tax=Paraliomyxa miuraensis TaxID=376150 RepID=UPI0022543239|nr:AAA family ATPase [Paraliomyxa miuraensis]MCX4243177.1 AAA family ATPase [Paraliomyxa miuraensis]
MTSRFALPPLADGVTLCAFGVDNLRALRMEQPVELRRLTLLAGRNGIGKSTFARVFPLLRQSAAKRKREPLLWWERGEVDFGRFDTAVRQGAEDMTFTFGFADADGTRWTARSVLVGDNGWSRVRRVEVEHGDRWLSLRFDGGVLEAVEGRAADDSFLAAEGSAIEWLLPGLDLIPGELFPIPDPDHVEDAKGRIIREAYPEEDATTQVLRLMRAHPSLNDWLPWTTSDELDQLFEDQEQWKRLLEDPELGHRLRRSNFCHWALRRLSDARFLVEGIGNRTAYIGPFREEPERAYAPQGIAVDRLDPSGASLAMFLVALSDEERADLNTELRAKLGFEVNVEAAGGRYSLYIELSDGRYNLVDVGYGYSQVLPVAVQLWASRRTQSTSRSPTSDAVIVIEQPELHLHPHHQVLMAQALGAFAADAQGPIQIIETHSDHLIGEIGMMIARGQLAPERAGVLCFEPHPEGGTRVFMASFSEDGALRDWPVGFLSP